MRYCSDVSSRNVGCTNFFMFRESYVFHTARPTPTRKIPIPYVRSPVFSLYVMREACRAPAIRTNLESRYNRARPTISATNEQSANNEITLVCASSPLVKRDSREWRRDVDDRHEMFGIAEEICERAHIHTYTWPWRNSVHTIECFHRY